MPDSANRDAFERKLTRELSKLLSDTRNSLINSIYHEGFTQGELASIPASELALFRGDLNRVLQPKLTELFIDTAQGYADTLSYHIDEGELSKLASDWAKTAIPALVEQLLSTTQESLANVAETAPDLPLDKRALGILLGGIGLFGLSRAIMIAQDQATRARTAAEDAFNQDLLSNDDIAEIIEVWYTRRDERVCVRCFPLHGKEMGDGWTSPPPLHPRCRCERKFKIIRADGSVSIVNSREEINDGKKPVS